MTEPYEPELGQVIFGNKAGAFDCPDFVDAMIQFLLWRTGLVFWNRKQREWDRIEDPGIQGVKFRPYCWDEDSTEADKPNLAFDGVEIRWYKYPGRGMSVNKDWTPVELVAWFDKIHKLLVEFQHESIS